MDIQLLLISHTKQTSIHMLAPFHTHRALVTRRALPPWTTSKEVWVVETLLQQPQGAVVTGAVVGAGEEIQAL